MSSRVTFSQEELSKSSSCLMLDDVVANWYTKEIIYHSGILRSAHSVRSLAAWLMLILAIPVIPVYLIVSILIEGQVLTLILIDPPVLLACIASIIALYVIRTMQRSGRMVSGDKPLMEKVAEKTLKAPAFVLLTYICMAISLLLFGKVIEFFQKGSMESMLIGGVLGLIGIIFLLATFACVAGTAHEIANIFRSTKGEQRSVVDMLQHRKFHKSQIVYTGEFIAFTAAFVLIYVASILCSFKFISILNLPVVILLIYIFPPIGVVIYYYMTKVIEQESKRLYEEGDVKLIYSVRSLVHPRMDVNINCLRTTVMFPSWPKYLITALMVGGTLVGILLGEYVWISYALILGGLAMMLVKVLEFITYRRKYGKIFIYDIKYLARVPYLAINTHRSETKVHYIEDYAKVLGMILLFNIIPALVLVTYIHLTLGLMYVSAQVGFSIFEIIPQLEGYAIYGLAVSFISILLAMLAVGFFGYLEARKILTGYLIKNVQENILELENTETVREDYVEYVYPEFFKVYLGSTRMMPHRKSKRIVTDVLRDGATITRGARSVDISQKIDTYGPYYNEVILTPVSIATILIILTFLCGFVVILGMVSGITGLEFTHIWYLPLFSLIFIAPAILMTFPNICLLYTSPSPRDRG